jgi:hypothetical protein
MTLMLATEATNEPERKPIAPGSLLEQWAGNETMRHVPSIDWMIRKLDGDLRSRIEKLCAPFTDLPIDHPRHAEIENALRALCRSLDRLAEAAKHARNGHGPNDVAGHVSWSLSHTLGALRSVDPATFGRRYPVQTHERSKAEPVYGAFVTVIQHVERLVPLVRQIDPSLDERLLDGLVKLEHPVDDRLLVPIA